MKSIVLLGYNPQTTTLTKDLEHTCLWSLVSEVQLQ